MKLKIFLVIITLSNTLYAQLPENIDLEADNIIFQKNNHLLQATSNVILSYENLTTYTENFIYDTKLSEVKLPTFLKLSNQQQSLTADSLVYNFKKNNGHAKNITIKSNKLTLKTERASISPLKATLHNTSISNCSLKEKHIAIQSEKIDVYPMLGIINARKNWLDIHFLPFRIPIPYFPYGTKTQNILGKNQYIPELGENSIMGKYAIYKSSYMLNKYISGTTDIGYTENLYWIIGGSNTIYKNKYFSQAIRYHYYNVIQTTALYSISKITFYKNKKKKLNTNIIDKLITPFLYQNQLENNELNFILQKKGIFYNYWVDYLPKIEFFIPKLNYHNTIIDTRLSISKTTEATNDTILTKKQHIHLQNSLTKEITLTKKLQIIPELNTNINQYTNTHHWNQLFFITKFKLNTLLNPEISYLQKIINKGFSPFQHEQKFALINNEVGLKIKKHTKKIQLEYESFFTIESQEFRKQNIFFLYKFHCWGLGIKWKIKEQAFSIQFALN
tara:strand:- start:9263 stop:10774 length:1512 start_codon:yes stop_codon:yes gene_type:complete